MITDPAKRGPAARGRQARVALYCSLRMGGKTKMQAADALGVSVATAITYERQWQELVEKQKSETEKQSRIGVISKSALAVRLSQAIASEGTPVQYLSALSRALAELQGYNAPKSIDLHDSRPVKPISELLDQWNKERTRGAPQDKLQSISSGQSPAATDLGKRPRQPVDSKAVTVSSDVSSKEVKEVLASVIISNDLENEKSNGQTK